MIYFLNSSPRYGNKQARRMRALVKAEISLKLFFLRNSLFNFLIVKKEKNNKNPAEKNKI
jgi:hypothetical protein